MLRDDVQQTCTTRAALFFITVVAVMMLESAILALAAQPDSLPMPMASSRVSPDRLASYSDQAVDWLEQYLRIDTTNPPGNEIQAAKFIKRILDEEGIENQIFEYQPGRADVWARLPHTSAQAKRPLILLNHMDVVTSDAAHWRVPPFSGQMLDGSIYGRGAQDMKNEGIAQLMAMVMAKREHVALSRDIIFLAVSDEEAEGTGTDWMIANHRDLLGNAEFLINEGGENLVENGRVRFIGVDVGEKTPFWLHMVARGRPGHGSRPIADSAPNRLVRALDRVLAYRTPYKVLPVVEEFLREMAPYEPPERAKRFRNVRQALQDPHFEEQVDHDESLNFLVRNTISLTMMGGSEQTNVIPSEAWANLDVRLLPGEDPNKFLDTIRKVVNDPDVTVEPVPGNFRTSNASRTDTALYNAIRQASAEYFPGVPVVPRLTSGYTENQRYRPLGVDAYGFTPYTATDAEGSSEHGNDERIRVEEVRRGPRILYDVVMAVAGE
ncbi:MAG TPA: M20/M25/M40 family metallo-hydrolase [Terriglobales bacterium]|nr:M20/M25/M40 family metallo-hydrolase [Terriglobales bacterium]